MARLPSLLALAAALAVSAPAAAQLVPADTLAPPPNTETLDIRVFRAVYNLDEPVFVAVVHRVNRASHVAFIGTVPAMAAGTLLAGGDWDPVLRMALSEGGSMAATFATKNLVRRPRPFNGLEGVEQRGNTGRAIDPYSFPSGHSSTAFALATSASLSYPEWYVIVPAYAWAATTALARVWHGVHYPTDIIAGAGLGAGAAVLVHLLVPEVDGDVDDEEDPLATGRVPPPIVSFRLSF